MQTANKIVLIGIGYRPLNGRAADVLRHAGVVLASSRLLDVFRRYHEYDAVKDLITVIDKVPDTIAFLRDRTPQSPHEPLVLLASGDPLFFGIGRRMIEEFGSERVEILPDLSSMQEAFARIRLAWDDAFCISVHGGPDIAKRRTLPYEVADIPGLAARHGKLAVLTDRVNSPRVIAEALLAAFGVQEADFVFHVCEKLGYPDERIWSGTIDEAARLSFADPNVVIVQRRSPASGGASPGEIHFGLKEEEIAHSRGLITKDEVRAVAIHKLRLPQRGVLWDIGAGSGSVSIEAARMVPGLKVCAVERSEEQIAHLTANRSTFGARNLEILQGSAPDALTALPAPDRVFIGGSGGNLGAILLTVQERMTSGIVVINAATLETLNEAVTELEKLGFAVEVSEISVSRAKPVAGKRLMAALNPIYVVSGVKG